MKAGGQFFLLAVVHSNFKRSVFFCFVKLPVLVLKAQDTRVAAPQVQVPKASCAPGVACKLGEFPQILPGYMALADAPLYTYSCRSTLACPGGNTEACANNASGIACGKCSDGWTFSDDGCIECYSEDVSRYVSFVAVPIVSPVVLYFLAKKGASDIENWASATGAIGSAFAFADGTALHALQ